MKRSLALWAPRNGARTGVFDSETGLRRTWRGIQLDNLERDVALARIDNSRTIDGVPLREIHLRNAWRRIVDILAEDADLLAGQMTGAAGTRALADALFGWIPPSKEAVA